MKLARPNRMSRKWRAVDRIFTEEIPFEKRRIVLTAVTFPGRIIANNTYCDKDGHPCLVIISAEAAAGHRIVHSEKATAEALGISVESVGFIIGVWDGADDHERTAFLERMKNHLVLIQRQWDTAQCLHILQKHYGLRYAGFTIR